MQVPTKTPLARSKGLVVEELGDELLVYDLDADRAHSLRPDAAKVWQRCDGKTSADALGAELGLDRETIDRALEELSACDLLETAVDSAPGSTRRELSVKMVKAGAAVAAAPLILSVAAPPAWAALTPAQCIALSFSSQNCGAGAGSNGCTNPANGCCCCNPPCNTAACPTCPSPSSPSGTKWCADSTATCISVCNTPASKTNQVSC